MMRHIKSGVLSLIILVLSSAAFLSFEAFSINDDVITYNISGNQCSVQSCDTEATGEIIIPDTYNGAVVTSVGNGAFKDCSKISGIVLPETVETIGSEAFSGCVNLSSVTIPDSVVSLGDSLFYKCGNLTEVSLSESLTEIPEKTFYYCAKLQYVAMPSGVAVIEQDAFYGCRLLKKVVLPESTVTLMKSSFKDCSSLESVYIPAGIIDIGVDAFDKCESLNKVYYSGKSTFPENFNIFSGNKLLTDAVWVFEHSHSLSDKTNVVGATCTHEGYSEFLCECGFYGRSNFTPSTGHNLSVFTVLKQPDCRNEGLIKVSCSKCNYSETMVTPTNAHKIVTDEKIDATCFENGKTKGSHCYVCGEIIEKQETIPALGHDYREKIYDKAHLVSAPTYTKEAVYRYSCIRCSAVGGKTHTGAKLVLGAPSQIASSSTSKSVTLAWSNVKDADGYGIYYKNAEKKWVLYKKIPGRTISFSSLPSGRIYTFAVKAYVVENGKIIASPYHQIITEATKPAKPAKIVAKQNETAIKISWSAVSGATGYRVYGYNAKAGCWVVLKTATKSCSNITQNLKSGNYYKFAVRPYIDLGTKIVWCESYGEIITATKPLSPTLKSTALAGAVRLQWSKVNGADGYVIYGSKKPDSGYVRLKVTTGVEHTVAGLGRGQTYYFRAFSVKRTNSGYVFSYASDIKSAKTR